MLNRRRFYNLVGNHKNKDISKGLYDKEKHINTKYLLQLKQLAGDTCYHCGVQLDWSNTVHVRRDNQPTLQRINNELGHTIGNVCFACFSCNVKKRMENRHAILERFDKNTTYTYDEIRFLLMS